MDGKWIAYESDESGAFEIYVHPYPEVSRGKWVVFVSGDREPLWAPDGSELYYRDGTNFVAAPIHTSTGFSADRQQVLFPDKYGRSIARNYDITPEGKKFVVTKATGDEITGKQNRIFVVENWFEDFERLAPHPEAN